MNGFSCSGGGPSQADTCFTTCGDWYTVGLESCDDGTDDDIGCLISCTGIKPGFDCIL